MADFLRLCFLFCLGLACVEASGKACDDIDPKACADMAQQNPNLCLEPMLSQSACPKLCGNCPLTCYSCNTTSPDVRSCKSVTCDKNKLCMAKTIRSTRTGKIKYSLGCATETVCDGGRKRALHSRSVTLDCCDSDLCNNPVTTTTSTTTTTTTTTTPSTTSSTTSSTTTPSTTTVDPCTNSPCAHGLCLPLKDGTFRCTCSPGYTGRLCDTYDPCASSPCVHGSCSAVANRFFRCTCDSGFNGYRCDKVDPCASSPCVHGSCSTLASGSFHCTCDSGFRGYLCDKVCLRDIIFLVDQYSLNDRSVKNFLVQLVNGMNIGVGGSRVALASFDSTVYFKWELNTHLSRGALLFALEHLPYERTSGSLSVISKAMLGLLQKYGTVTQSRGMYGDRPTVPDVAVFITTKFYASNLIGQYQGLLHSLMSRVVTVGVGSVYHPTLEALATDSRHALYVNRYTDLNATDFKEKVLNEICL